MGKKYLDTKENTLESSILGVWAEAAKKVDETNKNDKSDDGEGLDAVQPKAVKKKFKDRKDTDIDNDGDTDSSDKFLHKKRKAISKAMKDEGNAFGMALKAAKDKGEKTFVVAGKKYDVKEETDLDEGKVTKKERDRLEDQNEHGLLALKLTQAYGTPEEVKKIKEINKRHKQKGSIEYKDQKERDAISNKYYKMAEAADLDEGLGVAEDIPAMEIGTDRYREYASDLTPGETDPEWVQARDFKVASMKEALAKVWGLDEKALDKASKEDYDEEDEELKPVKGSKTMTGGKVAKIDTKPKMD
jgi:hypothetical protein